MKRPVELEQLLADLQAENPASQVAAQPDGKLIIVLEEDDTRHEFNVSEAKLLLANPDTVNRLFDALNYPNETFVELHGLEVEPNVISELESFASTVDEM